NRVTVVGCDQFGVDVQCAKIVDQHREPAALRLAQHALEKRGLARAEEAADDSQRQAGGRRTRTTPDAVGRRLRMLHVVAGSGITRPPRTVPATRTSFSASGATASGSSCSTQKS